MDPSDPTYRDMMAQALLGGVYQPGLSPAYTMVNPTTAYGKSAITGNPTAPGGMLANAPGTIDPNTVQGASALNQLQPNVLAAWYNQNGMGQS